MVRIEQRARPDRAKAAIVNQGMTWPTSTAALLPPNSLSVWKTETWKDYVAPIVRRGADGGREGVLATYGMVPREGDGQRLGLDVAAIPDPRHGRNKARRALHRARPKRQVASDAETLDSTEGSLNECSLKNRIQLELPKAEPGRLEAAGFQWGKASSR